MTRLAAAQCRDTLRILRPAAVVLAPALGLLSGCGLPRPGGPVVALARELFWEPRPGVATRVTRSRSKPAAHLDAADAGALLGVALLGGPRNAIDAALRDRGITTNAVRGKPSGISFARFRRLVRLLRDTLRDPTTHALGRNMWLQLAWEASATKADVLAFYRGLELYLPAVVRREADLGAFLTSAFDQRHLSDADVERAAARLLQPGDDDGAALEVVVASIAALNHSKAPLVLQRHAYKGGAPKPDCVELCAREIVDFLLWDGFELRTSRLPRGCAAAEFYAAAQSAAAWFEMCQEVDGCAYLSAAPGGERYELEPTLTNVANVLSRLAGLEERRTFSDFVANWNALQGDAVSADVSRSGTYRPPLADAPRFRQVLELRRPGAPHSLEVIMETDPPIAIATHKRADAGWGAAVLEQHYNAARRHALEARPASSLRRAVAEALWPVVLGDGWLAAVLAGGGGGVCAAILSARWRSEEKTWRPISEPATADGAGAQAIDAARRQRHRRAVDAVSHLGRASASAPLADELLPWLLGEVPEDLDAVDLAAALRRSWPPQTLFDVATLRAIDVRADAALLRSLLRLPVADAAAAARAAPSSLRLAVSHVRLYLKG